MRIASNSDPASITRFFVPGAGGSLGEFEYERLRACALRETGFLPLQRRIHAIACRIAGRDQTIEVGLPDPIDGADVVAIIDLGKHLPYGVFTTADTEAPTRLVGKPVYSVTDFR